MIILCPQCGTNLVLTVVIRDGKESIFHSCPKCTCEQRELAEAAVGGEGFQAGRFSKGGQNPPNTSSTRPAAPIGSCGGGEIMGTTDQLYEMFRERQGGRDELPRDEVDDIVAEWNAIFNANVSTEYHTDVMERLGMIEICWLGIRCIPKEQWK